MTYPPAGGASPAWQNQTPYQPYPRRATTNTFAILALIFGILGGVILSVIFGIIALRQIKRRGDRGRGLAITGLLLSGAWIVIITLVIVAAVALSPQRSESGQVTAPGSVSVADVRVGDCFNGALEGEIRDVSVIPCGQPHDAETIDRFDLPAGSWPGDDQVIGRAESGCEKRVTDRLERSPQAKRLELYHIHPTRTSWGLGDRGVTCVVGLTGGAKLTGRVR